MLYLAGRLRRGPCSACCRPAGPLARTPRAAPAEPSLPPGPLPPAATWRCAGWGLPFCFWAATNFAQKKLAAVDAACMIHPARKDVGEGLGRGCCRATPNTIATLQACLHTSLSSPACTCGTRHLWAQPANRAALAMQLCELADGCRPAAGEKLLVSERIRRGLVKPGSIYARFAELTPFASPKAEQDAVWKVSRGRAAGCCAGAAGREKQRGRALAG